MRKTYLLDSGRVLVSEIRKIKWFSNAIEVNLYISTAKNGNISAKIAWTDILESPYETQFPKAIKTLQGGMEQLRYEMIKAGATSEEAKKFLKEVKEAAVSDYRLYKFEQERELREKDAKERAEAFKKELKTLLNKYQFDLVMTTEPITRSWEFDGSIADLILEDNKYDTGDEKVTLATVEDYESFTFK